ncbi:suppressor of fused domain protein [Paenibacillus glycanilyticus]|uniref:suppressor of fused domain protein n=1 Tax=Paenibacillus glycanilyticus TaxID=126569 RepID=UPI0024E0A13B|nr:suppressor of fused domain protein [Paenibacillus glycanilyticus]
MAKSDDEAIELITQHVEKHIGPVEAVFHEMVSDLIHLDVLYVAPTKERNFITLITCGMSSLPMTVPKGAEAFRYAELMICLPADWEMSEESLKKEDHYWPIGNLKMLARLPHEYNTWFYTDHTIPNGDPAEPYASNTKLSGMMVTIPSTVESPEEFFTLKLHEHKDVHFFSITPLYKEEMNYKLKHGADAMLAKLEQAGVSQIVDPNRKNTCKKRFGLF